MTDIEKTAAEIEVEIATCIEEKLQPSVAMHGGQISLKEWDHDNVLQLILCLVLVQDVLCQCKH